MSHRRTKNSVNTQDVLKYVAISLILVIPVSAIIVVVISSQQTTGGGTTTQTINFIPENFDDGAFAVDNGWTTYTLHNSTRIYNTSDGTLMHINNRDWRAVDLRFNITTTTKLSFSFLLKYNDSIFSEETYGIMLFRSDRKIYFRPFEGGILTTRWFAWNITVDENDVNVLVRYDDFDGTIKYNLTSTLKYDLNTALPANTISMVDQIGFWIRSAATHTYILNMTGQIFT